MDQIDEQILEILSGNAKTPMQKISQRLSIPITTVHNRIKRLEKHGIIRNYTINIDYERLGKEVYAIVLISLNHAVLKQANLSIKELMKKIKWISGVERVSEITGPKDIMIRVRASDVHELDRILTEDLRKVEGIEQTDTMIILHDIQ